MGKAELNIDPELLEQAAAAGLNVDILIERMLRLALQKADPAGAKARAAKWAEENAEAIQAHKERIEKYGVFGEDLRTW